MIYTDYTPGGAKVTVISNGRMHRSLHIMAADRDYVTFSIEGPRGGQLGIVRVSKDDLAEALLRAGIAQRR